MHSVPELDPQDEQIFLDFGVATLGELQHILNKESAEKQVYSLIPKHVSQITNSNKFNKLRAA